MLAFKTLVIFTHFDSWINNQRVSASWLHMLGGRGTFGNQCDFFIGIVGTLHYFELGFWHPRKQLGSIK